MRQTRAFGRDCDDLWFATGQRKDLFEHKPAAENQLARLFDGNAGASGLTGGDGSSRRNIALANILCQRRANDLTEIELPDDFHGRQAACSSRFIWPPRRLLCAVRWSTRSSISCRKSGSALAMKSGFLSLFSV